jgi:hypothetical protein
MDNPINPPFIDVHWFSHSNAIRDFPAMFDGTGGSQISYAAMDPEETLVKFVGWNSSGYLITMLKFF